MTLKNRHVEIIDLRVSCYIGKLNTGEEIKISKQGLKEKMFLGSYYVSGEFKKGLFGKVLIVSSFEKEKVSGMFDEYEMSVIETQRRIQEKNHQEASNEYHRRNRKEKLLDIEKSNTWSDYK